MDFQHLVKILLKKWNLDIINYSTEKNEIIVKILYLTGMNHYIGVNHDNGNTYSNSCCYHYRNLCILTYKMSRISERTAQIMNEQTEAMSRPYIIIQPMVRPHSQFLYLKIYNSGKTPALNVKLELDKDFYQLMNQLKT